MQVWALDWVCWRVDSVHTHACSQWVRAVSGKCVLIGSASVTFVGHAVCCVGYAAEERGVEMWRLPRTTDLSVVHSLVGVRVRLLATLRSVRLLAPTSKAALRSDLWGSVLKVENIYPDIKKFK
jgi:hypothetical protein